MPSAEQSDENDGAAERQDETAAHVADSSAEESPDAAGEPADADLKVAAAVADLPVPRRRSGLRRVTLVGALALVVALAVSAFATSASASGDVDQRFLDATRSQGLVVAGGDQQSLLVSAARKICERRENHATVAQRRATALSADELRSVARTFGGDARGFTSLALETYCPN